MATYAVLNSENVVTNKIVADSIELAQEITGSTCVEYENPLEVEIGFTWDGSSFTNPNPFVPTEPTE